MSGPSRIRSGESESIPTTQPRRASFAISTLVSSFWSSSGSCNPASHSQPLQQATDPDASFEWDRRRPINAYRPDSRTGLDNNRPANNSNFSRSVSFDFTDPSSSPGVVVAGNRRSSSQIHGANMYDGQDSGFDLERQSTARARPSASAFSHLEGRSYRFQPAHDTASLSNSLLSNSYTATSGAIRDDTAHLAGMVLSEEEDSSVNGSGIYDIGEEEDFGLEYDPTNPTSSHLPTGPSNLTRAIAASRAASPEIPSTSAPVLDGSEATPRATPVVLSPVAIAKGIVSEQERPLADQGESTPLLSSANEINTLIMRRSRSGSKQYQADPTRRNRSISTDRPSTDETSSFSLISDNNRAGIGYGALTQAEQSVTQQANGLAFSSRNQQHHPQQRTNPQPKLSPGWAFLPTKWRPGSGDIPVQKISSPRQHVQQMATSMRKLTWGSVIDASAEPIRLLPAVILGILLNVLDGVSYGMIMFPSAYPIFSGFGGDGVSMFFMTCIFAQLIYTLGGSIFKGGNGSMMIEVVPFFHILAKIIIDQLGDENPKAVIATTMVAFALSSILTGLAFMLLGALRLGALIGFFPRHILVGCIGGVGIFLIETGLEVCGQLKSEDGFQYNLDTLRYFFESGHMVALWLVPFLAAVLLRLITWRVHHPLIFPGFFLVIAILFYIVGVGILRIPISQLRLDGWVFDIGKEASQAFFYRFYTYFDFRQTSFSALWATMPTQLALVFFGVLHVPLNVPALGVSINEDNVDTDRELVAHGMSNILSGLCGTVPNYLCYVNSVLFYRVGGGSRLSGLMLAAGTGMVMIAGPGIIGYLPVLIVGALIFVLGIDLAKEALYDTVGRVNGWEYLTIWVIVVVMTYWDFVIGVLAGIVIACFFFVVQTSRRKTIRALFDGSVARSTVRRHMTQRHFLDEVGTQTQIVKLQGFLFFGTINSVEALIRRALDIAAWNQNPIRFLIVDFTLVSGVDFSAAEAFLRINRLLQAKDVVLVFCGLTPDSDVGIAMRSVDLWADRSENLEVFPSLNQALEWTENEYLRGLYASGLVAAKAFGQASLAAEGGLNVPDQKRKPAFVLDQSFDNSPRRHHLHEAAKTAVRNITKPATTTIATTAATTTALQVSAPGVLPRNPYSQPLSILTIIFRAYLDSEMDEEAFFPKLVPYFKKVRLAGGDVLWSRGDEPNGLYLIESGILKARYDFPQEQYEINEAMLAGTISGELTFLSNKERNTTVHAELDCVLWKLDKESFEQMYEEKPKEYREFVTVLLRVAGEEQQVLMSYLVSRLS